MHLRSSLRILPALALAVALAGTASSASAGPKDKDAQKLLDDAINTDYLNADFPKAEKKLKDAVTKCGSDGCSGDLLGKIHIALGTVFGVGLSKPDDAKAEFVLALKADGKAALDPSLTNPDLQKIYDAAKASAGSSSSSSGPSKPEPKPAPTGDANHTPPPESAVNTPLPLYIEPSEEVPLAKVVLRYKPFGAAQYKSVEMSKKGKGYGVKIPCEDTNTTGDLKYFFAFTGADGEAAGGLGSAKEPFRTTIKNDIEGDAPKLPGEKPPAQCKEKVECPPGLEGCESGTAPPKDGGKPHGDKGWKASCEQSSECKEGLVCLNNVCEEDAGGGGGGGDDKGKKKRMNLLTLGLQLDFLSIAGSTGVCDGTSASYACFLSQQQPSGKVLPSSSSQFFGKPTAYTTTDGIQGGGSFGDLRIDLGYDRQLLKNLGLSVGIRLGVAVFGGSPSPDNLDANGNPLPGSNPAIAPALGFHRFNYEGRLSYHILGASMMDPFKPRPYVFVTGGGAQVNASVPVVVCDSVVHTGETAQGCKTMTASTARNVNAYQITGLGFVGFGVGSTFGFTPIFGIFAELKFQFMVPTFGFVVAPVIGPAFNF